MDPRLARARAEPDPHEGAESPSRIDLERIRFAPSFSRLAEVTQVITAGATGSVVHNRLTHSIKVTAVARRIAVGLLATQPPELIRSLGGLDHVVVQAAAVSHDLGHPPFGHQGERVLDRLAREQFGLPDGFEGNAQTFRILTELEVHGPGDEGLNLTAATRAAVLKYPWGRSQSPDPHPASWPQPPRGAGLGPDGPGAAKFSAYDLDLAEMQTVLQAFPDLPPGRQTLECSVMDLADDIAYSLHDVEDFHRSGVLQFSPVSGEFRSWDADRRRFGSLSDGDLLSHGRMPGAGLERLRRRLRAKDGWIFDEEAFGDAVLLVGDEFVDGVLAEPYDGSMAADRAISGFTSRWIHHLISSVVLTAQPHVRSSFVELTREAWHQVSVLKFVHQYFILDRPDLAMFQRGQAETLTRLVTGFDQWLSDRIDAGRAPRRLLDLVNCADLGYRRVTEQTPELLAGRASETELARMGRGRGIIDFVSALTDAQAVAFAGRLAGTSDLLWSSGSL
ncbi:dNTP triphosphohydrolase [Microlunatus panaciterrae]|uniref:DGTPase n=1 Tax=Microlunatus panaciterrae TaxID=400768 RepID=A0ABS2RKG7_9ACTN|nr:dNTP triphosphohydrolase [Microlunatus panaciterrae]MBM7798661.1 dGTPase [Microlunatus panaciterrae]